MFAPAPVAALLFSRAFVTALLTAMPVSRSDQQIAASWGAALIPGTSRLFPEIYHPFISHPAFKEGV